MELKTLRGRSISMKGAVYSFDALIASLAVVLIVYLGIMVFWSVLERTERMAGANERDSKLLLLADYLVKEGVVLSDDRRVYQHQIDTKKLGTLDAKKLAEEFGVRGVGVGLEVGGEEVFSRGSGADCIRRAVFVPEYKRVGFLETCIG